MAYHLTAVKAMVGGAQRWNQLFPRIKASCSDFADEKFCLMITRRHPHPPSLPHPGRLPGTQWTSPGLYLDVLWRFACTCNKERGLIDQCTRFAVCSPLGQERTHKRHPHTQSYTESRYSNLMQWHDHIKIIFHDINGKVHLAACHNWVSKLRRQPHQ